MESFNSLETIIDNKPSIRNPSYLNQNHQNRYSCSSIQSNESDVYQKDKDSIQVIANQIKIPKRQKIMNEIVQTETRYVQDLLIIKKYYSDPLKELVGTPREILSKR